MITYDLNLCIGTDDPNKRLAVKCHDTGVNLRVHMQVCRHGKWQDTMEAYAIPEESTAVLRITKPDKKYCITDGTIENNYVLFNMVPQAFTAAGTCKAEVSLYGSDGRRITSGTFYIDVPEECICGCDLESENYIDVMSEQIRAAIDAAEKATNAAINPPKLSKDNTWLIWDAVSGQYVDSGVSAVPDAEVSPEDIEKAVSAYLEKNPPSSGVQFETDSSLTLKDGVLSVNTTDQMEQDNTLPITSAGVYATVGNIEALLKTI